MNLSGCGEGSFAQMAKTDGERSTKVSRFEFADRVREVPSCPRQRVLTEFYSYPDKMQL